MLPGLADADELQEAGLAAERVPLSGAAGGRFGGDLEIPVKGIDSRFEVKCRAGGFKFLYDNITGVYGLIVKQDRQEPLVVIRLSEFAELAK